MNNSLPLSIDTLNNRLGFHYFPDKNHYTQKDLDKWLPILGSLGAKWLVLLSPYQYAIPESFVTGLMRAGIEPIIQFTTSLSNPPTASEISPILKSYGRWGLRTILLYDRPNLRSAWSVNGWIQGDLINRFLDRFLPLADMSMHYGLNPVFPPLEPGGSYWDTTFLRASLETIMKRKRQDYFNNLVLSAYAWTGNHPLNWGTGGPERWPSAKAYQASSNLPDHRGFRIYDWYQSTTQAVLGKSCQVLLLQAGIPGTGLTIQKPQKQAALNLAIARLLTGEKVIDPENPLEILSPIPEQVISCNFWLLTAVSDSPYQEEIWFSENGEPTPKALGALNWQAQTKRKFINEVKFTSQSKYQSIASSESDNNKPLSQYLLLPEKNSDIADWEWNVILQYIKKNHPTIGFSCEEAMLASHIMVIGDDKVISEEEIDRLRQSGSIVERIIKSGTLLASLLAER